MSARNGPRRRREVQRRARRLAEERGWSYGRAMQAAGWMVARAANDQGTNRAY